MKAPIRVRRSGLLTKVVVLLVVVCSTVTLMSQRTQIRAKQAEYQKLNQQVAQLEQKNTQLQADLAGLGRDDSVRDIARRELGLVENGEIIFTDRGE